MISHEDWIRRAQSIDLNVRTQLRDRTPHLDSTRVSRQDETALEFEYFLRRELRKNLCVEEPSQQVRHVIMRFARARIQKQMTPVGISIREVIASMLRRSERRNPYTLRTLIASGRQSVNIRSDSVITRRILI